MRHAAGRGADHPSRLLTVLLAIAPVQPTYTQGEPIWLDLTFDGAAPAPLHVDDQLEIVATNSEGQPAFDPRHEPRNPNIGSGDLVDPAMAIDAARHVWLPPGTWEVKARLDPRVTGEPTTWVSTRLTVAPVGGPAEARAVVEAVPDTFAAYSLGHPIYVPILEPLVRTSDEDRAFRGLASCPCVEATEALFRLFDEAAEPRRWKVGDELLLRAPRPASHVEVSPEFIEHAWDERFDAQLLERGRAALAEAPADEPGVAFGVEVVQRFGDATDVPRLVAALERTLATPPPGSLAYYTIAELLHTLKKWPEQAAATGTSSTRARLLVDLVAGRDVVLEALEQGDPLVAGMAAAQTPSELTPATIDALVRLVGTSDAILARHVQRILSRPEPAVRDALLAAVSTAEGRRKVALLALLKSHTPVSD